ncbi:arginine--tRNA ligase [Motiliproteus coralliicola]|uniref:Arginine--tRNA ligase n=1 Tax=Motiliproteus coralliicola TaxID=2283196 RepID=A0A369WA08_9GAMM|nr:arginine--tRNA ligase [Motiliproteus coralliicola]RDE18143.1 arginine--tRNA ligase [Motiliproteus coralliicola]
MNIRDLLNHRVREAMTAAGIPAECQPMVAPSKNPQFGDYQANGAMGAAKAMKTNPRELAAKIIEQLDLEGIASSTEIAGPGFINISLDNGWLADQVTQLEQQRLGIEAADQPQTVVIDYSAPNLAKEMHVGHLRSTIIGDALARVLEAQGHKIIRQNHVGDWGTQFGMLITHLQDQQELDDGVALADLEAFYRAAKVRFDDEPEFAARARDNVVKLQAGEESALAMWRKFIAISVAHSEEIYSKLNVTLKHSDIHAESAYNDALPGIIETLQQQKLAVEDQGAQVVFLDELADKEGNPLPMIVQKSGGGYLYATTDLAAVQYRCQELQADRVLYFIDARQSLHMKQVFAVGRKAGFATEHCSLEHHPFGTMMGEDGKPFKTRSGGTVKLGELLDEAVVRAAQLLKDKDSDLSADEQADAARKIGIGAVKYADLAKTRTNDYIFSWDSMLSFEGNTAPYLQYAYTRIQSIFRKAGISPEQLEAPLQLVEPQEKALAMKLLQFGEVVDQVARDAYPHQLCNYLYELASLFMKFYEACPMLRSDIATETRDSRLRLSHSTAQVLQSGLELLGIEVMERM